MMKLFYIFVIIAGLWLLWVTQVPCLCMPMDLFVARKLVASPDQWSLQIDDAFAERLHWGEPEDDDNAKTHARVVAALKNRIELRRVLRGRHLWAGSMLVVLGLIGLIRERRITTLQRATASDAPTDAEAGPADAPSEPVADE
jgi:hypothetical protein